MTRLKSSRLVIFIKDFISIKKSDKSFLPKNIVINWITKVMRKESFMKSNNWILQRGISLFWLLLYFIIILLPSSFLHLYIVVFTKVQVTTTTLAFRNSSKYSSLSQLCCDLESLNFRWISCFPRKFLGIISKTPAL